MPESSSASNTTKSQLPAPRPYSSWFPTDYNHPLMDIHSRPPPAHPDHVKLYELLYNDHEAVSDEALRCVWANLEDTSCIRPGKTASEYVSSYTQKIDELKKTWAAPSFNASRDTLCHHIIDKSSRMPSLAPADLHLLIKDITICIPHVWDGYWQKFEQVRKSRQEEHARQQKAAGARSDEAARKMGLVGSPENIDMGMWDEDMADGKYPWDDSEESAESEGGKED